VLFVDRCAQGAQVTVCFSIAAANWEVISWACAMFAHFRAVEAFSDVFYGEFFFFLLLHVFVVAELASVGVGFAVTAANWHEFHGANAAFVSWQAIVYPSAISWVDNFQ